MITITPPPGAPPPEPTPTTAEMHAALVAALRAQGYTSVATPTGGRIWRKGARPAAGPGSVGVGVAA